MIQVAHREGKWGFQLGNAVVKVGASLCKQILHNIATGRFPPRQMYHKAGPIKTISRLLGMHLRKKFDSSILMIL